MAGGLFDLFSGSGGRTAARQQYQADTGGLNNARRDITQSTDKAVNRLNTAQDTAGNYLFNSLNNATGALNQGTGQAAGYYNQALPTWDNLVNLGNQGVRSYGDLVGVSGGDPRLIQEMLASTPGYQFTLNQGLEGLNRTANERGMLTSGNNSQDILKYATGLADQTYQNAVNNRLPYFGLAENAAQGRTGVLENLASLYGNNGRAIADLFSNYGANRGNLVTGTAAKTADLYSNQGTNIANLDTQKGQAKADMYGNMYNADQGASQNLWDAILGVTGLGTQLAGSYLSKPTTTYNFNTGHA